MTNGIATKDGIASIAKQGIGRIDSPDLRDALEAAYESPQGVEAAETAHRVFHRLVASRWPVETLSRFLSGWGRTHGTALFVSGLMVRLHRLAQKADEPAQSIYHRAAGEIAEVIAEDTGVDDDCLHHELFARFAGYLVGDDRWQLGRYAVPACERFRNYVQRQRLSASIDVEEALLTTAASENWNTGEYTFLDSLLTPWMIEVLGYPAGGVKEAMAYVSVHAGATELGHFLKALRAWQFYCQAAGRPADPLKARRAFESYLQQVGIAFAGLEEIF